ncbi:MAG: hypothetical protein GXO43_04550, partial [Crenarchaeota archaeon]|nr:hypothetical protein [Thermoproteota archaeon]
NKIPKYLFISILVLTMIIAPLQAITYSSPQPYQYLDQQGIQGPYTDHPVIAPAGFTADTNYYFTHGYGDYTVILADGVKAYIDTPGHPMLPVYTYKVEVDGYVPASAVHAYVYVEHFSVKHIDKPVLPAPKPLFCGLYNQTLQYVMDEKIYSADIYYPGKLLDVNVWHGMHGKTIISIRYYPVQYNPVTNTILYIDKASVYVNYPAPTPIYYAEKSLLILTTDKLVGTLGKLVDFYKSKGYNVTVVTTSYIWKNYKPINNITEYPGFYKPGFEDSYYKIIAKTYNWTLALKIIDYLNKTLGNYDNLLIIGNTSDIPPSFYYHYKLFDPYNNWVPTDYFYASPDLDLAPNIYVGRIPFSNPVLVGKVIQKIIAWYSSSASRSRDLYMTGGYPFGLSLMFGESAISMMNLKGQLSMFRVHMLTRTSMNYDRGSVLSILSGDKNALWYFALCHGSGTALGDRRIIRKNNIPSMVFELLASVADLESMRTNPSVPIVSSVACMNAAWDNNVPSPYFRPPTFGEAILLSPAGGIAYVGSARVAAEIGIMFYLLNGVEQVIYYGATFLHYNILKAYGSLMGRTNETTLGYVVDKGILDYLSSTPTIDQYVLGEAFKLSLLGDSNLILPVWKSPAEETRLSVFKLGNYVARLPSSMISPYSQGYLPIYGFGQKAWMYLMGSQGTVSVVNCKIISYYGRLMDFYMVNKTDISIPASGSYNYTLGFNNMLNGLILVKFGVFGWGEIRVFIGAVGVQVIPSVSGPGEPVTVKAYGLDLIGAREVNIYVAGRLLIPDLQLQYGSVDWKFALPYLAPGAYNVTVLPGGYIPADVLAAIMPFTMTEIKVIGKDSMIITSNAPAVIAAGSKINIVINTYYKGEPVDAKINITITGPTGPVKPEIKKLGQGSYLVVFEAAKPGRYTVDVEAVSSNGYLDLKGHNSFSIVAVSSLYNGFENINTELHTIAYSLTNNFTTLSTLLKTQVITAIKNNGEEIKNLENNMANIETILSSLKTGLNNINTTLDKLIPSIETIKSNTQNIMNEISASKQAIINGITSLQNNIAQNITALQDKLSTTTLYSEGGLALSVIILVAVIVLGLIKKK